MRENEQTAQSIDTKAKEQFEQAIVEIIVFAADDMITTSGGSAHEDDIILPRDEF